jgi:hypothetical protein
MTVSGAGRAFEQLPIALDYGAPAERGEKYGGRTRQSQTFRSLNRGVAPPPAVASSKRRHARKGPPRPRPRKDGGESGFENKAHATARGSVWGEMGRLDVDPFDQKKINERLKATRQMDFSVLRGMDTDTTRRTKPNEKVNYERLRQLAVSSKRPPPNPAAQTIFRTQLNKTAPPYVDFKWKPPKHFRTFDPTQFARDRKAKIDLADVARWRPESWNPVPEFCHKPTRDIGECD